jgi:hypothetical protein
VDVNVAEGGTDVRVCVEEGRGVDISVELPEQAANKIKIRIQTVK